MDMVLEGWHVLKLLQHRRSPQYEHFRVRYTYHFNIVVQRRSRTRIARCTNETTMSYDVAYVGFTIEKDKAITTRLRRVVTLHLFVAGETSQVLSNLQILIILIVLG